MFLPSVCKYPLTNIVPGKGVHPLHPHKGFALDPVLTTLRAVKEKEKGTTVDQPCLFAFGGLK